MPQSFQEYHERWLQAMQQGRFNELSGDSDLTIESCVIGEEVLSSFPGMGEGAIHFPDFGDAICFYRYFHIPNELELPKDPSRVDAEQSLDDLLQEFVQQGYRTEMGERLREIINQSPLDVDLYKIFVLPGDLPGLLSFVGHPFADYDAYENEAEAEAHAPAFDLNNSNHREALRESIWMVGR